MITSLLGVLFDGLAYGMLLFLISVGLSVTLGLMNFINLAHGAFAMLGGYVCMLVLQRWGLPFLMALPLAFVISALAGLLLGVIDVAGKYYVPQIGAFIIYAMMVILLVLRPQGLISRK